MINIIQGDNLEELKKFPDGHFNLIYIDPPFNTNKIQSKKTIKTVSNLDGDRTGYQGKKYSTDFLGEMGYSDIFDNYYEFLIPRLEEGYRVLAPNGTFCFHIDPRESHYCKVALDQIFGRQNFLNEIIWSFDYGARSKKKWSTKHNTIFIYTKNIKDYVFNYDKIDRIPYMAPGMVSKEKAKLGKTQTDCWWNTIVPTMGKEKTGYPNQKPLGILERIVKVHSNPGDKLLDYFAGSGSFGDAANRNGRDCVLIDQGTEAISVMKKRFPEEEKVTENKVEKSA